MKLTEKGKRRIGTAVLVISAALFLYALANLLHYYDQGKKQKDLTGEMSLLRTRLLEDAKEKTESAGEPAPDRSAKAGEAEEALTIEQLEALYNEMHQINEDYVLWITVPDTGIDYPVVQLDNEYYLKHDFYDRRNSRGTVFLDQSCDPEGKMLLLHGHHMKDGTMFAPLTSYKNEEFRKEHLQVRLSLKGEERSYRFFAGALVDLTNDTSFLYEKLPAGQAELKAYLELIRSAAFWYEEPTLTGDDGILVLSTCDYGTKDQRLVMFALRETDLREK